MKAKWRQLADIFWTFFRMSPVTFGGGFAMIPVLEREAVYRKKWIRQDEVADVLAISQTIPGAVALNAASFVGFRVAGVAGAVAAIVGMLLPAFLIVVGLAAAFVVFQHHPKVAGALQGIKPAVLALIVYAGYRVAKSALVGKWAIGLAAAAGLLLLQGSISPIWVIVLGGAAGVSLGIWKRRNGQTLPRSRGHSEVDADYFIGDGI